MANAPLLQVDNVGVTLRNQTIIRGISFAVARGDFLAIIGPNGAGKTVLVKTLLGQLPHTGNIAWSPNVHIGYVPQQIDLDRYLTITLSDFLHLKTSILKTPTTEITEALRLVGLPAQTLKTPLNALSGGQLQRGLIAFALIGNPDVIFFDEPTASVDAPGEEQIYELLHRLQDERGMAIVLVSRELDLVSRYASHILCLNRDMICYGDPGISLKPEMLTKLYGTSSTHVHHL